MGMRIALRKARILFRVISFCPFEEVLQGVELACSFPVGEFLADEFKDLAFVFGKLRAVLFLISRKERMIGSELLQDQQWVDGVVRIDVA